MKQRLFAIIFSAISVACDASSVESPDLTQIRIRDRLCETLVYVGVIGSDFDTALDSLRKRKGIVSAIDLEPLKVLFDYDNRLFYGIGYGDCGMYSDVLDTKGNYYLRTWYCDEERYDYVPFVDEGKVWYCGYWHPNRVSPVTPEDPLGVGIDCIFTMHGDTIINAREYKKVYCEFGEYYGDQEQHYYCAVREEACHVFIVEGDTQEEKLLYDFSSPKESKRITCNGVSLTRSAGQMFYLLRPNQNCYFLLSDETRPDFTPDDYAYWFEGLGARYNNPFAFELKVLPFDNPKLGNRLNVHTCMKDGKYIFNILWFSDPLGLTAVRSASINATGTNTYGNFYDLQGRRLNAKPRKGIYIRDGRKVVVK